MMSTEKIIFQSPEKSGDSRVPCVRQAAEAGQLLPEHLVDLPQSPVLPVVSTVLWVAVVLICFVTYSSGCAFCFPVAK